MRFANLALAVLVALPATASAYKLKADGTGTPVRWASKQITFRLPRHIPQGISESDVRAAVVASLATWASATGLTLQVEPGDEDAKIGYSSSDKADNHNDILLIDHDWKYDTNALAATVLTIDEDSHQIVDADIALNVEGNNFKALPATSVPGGVYDDLQNTLTHEIGHALGLAHSEVAQACMYGASSHGEVSKRALADDDQAAADFLYDPRKGIPAPAAQVQNMAEAMLTVGCSSTGGGVPSLALALLPLLLLRKDRARYRLERS